MSTTRCPHCLAQNLYKCTKCNSVYCLTCKKMISGDKIKNLIGGMDKNCPICRSFGAVIKMK
ncbi:MAG: hypothetical protein SNJ29_11895 [Rikenellaceae bacterium]